jgi:hypothetical protein
MITPALLGALSVAVAGGGGTTDPFFANVKSLMHFESSLADTKGLTWVTATGSPVITGSSPLVGVGSLSCPNAAIRTDGSTAYAIDGPADFAIELSVRFSALPSGGAACLASHYVSSGAGWSIQFRNDGSDRLQINMSGDTGNASAPWSPSTGVNYVVAVTRVSGNIYFFVDGVMIGTPVANTAGTVSAAPYMVLGALYLSGSFIQVLNGVVDEWRLTIGTGRYSAGYTPAPPFPDS